MFHYKILFFFLCFISPVFQTGQWTPVDFDDSSLLSQSFSQIQQYTIAQLTKYGIISESFEHKSYANVYTQVVAGTNWKFDLLIYNENEERTINVLLWQKLPQEEEKFHLSHVCVDIPDNLEGNRIVGSWTEAINEDFDDNLLMDTMMILLYE